MPCPRILLSHPEPVSEPRMMPMLQACSKYSPSDRALFVDGYAGLCRVDLNGGRALEICSGRGKLAMSLAEAFPRADVIGLDLYVPEGPDIDDANIRLPGLSYIKGNAFDLSTYNDGSFDLVFGQAALHHLAHDAGGLCREVLRILKPGGRLIFIFEPLGHNPAVAAIRAVRMAAHELPDESNLFLSQFERMLGEGFSSCEVHVFNLLGYPLKALSGRFRSVVNFVEKLDALLFRRFPALLRYGANCNVIFTK
jgi:SAM-dependent methyltransferase